MTRLDDKRRSFREWRASQPPRDPAAPAAMESREVQPGPRVSKRGAPCPLSDPGMLSKARSMARVLGSKRVPAEVAEARNAECRVCGHAWVINQKTFCGCCHCPMTAAAACERKNEFAGHSCPRPDPAFGVWEEGVRGSVATALMGTVEAASQAVRGGFKRVSKED